MASCASCNQPLEPESAFCGFCGAAVLTAVDVSEAPTQTPPPTTPPPRGPTLGTASPGPTSPPRHAHAPSLTQRGFFASLFDFSFTSLITTKIIKVLYVISVIFIGLFSLAFVFYAFHVSPTLGLVVLIIVAPLEALFWLIYTRVIMELFIALFRIAENTSELVAQGRVAG